MNITLDIFSQICPPGVTDPVHDGGAVYIDRNSGSGEKTGVDIDLRNRTVSDGIGPFPQLPEFGQRHRKDCYVRQEDNSGHNAHDIHQKAFFRIELGNNDSGEQGRKRQKDTARDNYLPDDLGL